MMTVYQAIEEMRRLTQLGEPFKFSFMSYHKAKQKSSGIIVVQKAVLRHKSAGENSDNNDIIEPYLDLSTNQPREFYQPALMTFNDQQLQLT